MLRYPLLFSYPLANYPPKGRVSLATQNVMFRKRFGDNHGHTHTEETLRIFPAAIEIYGRINKHQKTFAPPRCEPSRPSPLLIALFTHFKYKIVMC